MKGIKENQIFNLFDTNGRRNDVSEAFNDYLQILLEINNQHHLVWGNFPKSLAQYEYYRRVIAKSPDVFEEHKPFDKLEAEIDKYPKLRKAIDRLDINWISKNLSEIPKELIKKFDGGIEDRARHFSSNLVRMGFANGNRKITSSGELLLGHTDIQRDSLEKMLPIDNMNVIYLRQLLKFKVFDSKVNRYYAPFLMAIYVLMKRPSLEFNVFKEIIQVGSPYTEIKDLDGYIINYKECDDCENYEVEIPEEIDDKNELSKDVFFKFFKSGKNKKYKEKYWDFYILLWEYKHKKSKENLNKLLDFYEMNTTALNSAFGMRKNIFGYKTGTRPTIEVFEKKYNKFKGRGLNKKIYIEFIKSKRLNMIYEYGDTTKRIFNITGLIDFSNGCVSLANRELLECIFDKEKIKSCIWGTSNKDEYLNSLYDTLSLSEIMNYTSDDINSVNQKMAHTFGMDDIEAIIVKLENDKRSRFNKFVENNFPISQVKKIMRMFANRKNDAKIKKLVSEDASVPTIYEYMVGIAWYYFSGKTIDLLQSYGLSYGADFRPTFHAQGGRGDIVINSKDRVIMLEATLMNTNNQKRGEWEPVLRHSINLKVEEKTNGTMREVTTFFIADEFDNNTINIWKAVASVPLESSTRKGEFTDNVVIMPISSDELCSLMDKSDRYENIIKTVHDSFEVETSKFNKEWRNELVTKFL